MNLLRSLVHLVGVLFIAGSAATVMAQIVGVAALSNRGMLTQGKLVRYAGVVYGVEPIDLSPSRDASPEKTSKERSPEEALAGRVQNTPSIAARQTAIRKGTDDIRGEVLRLKYKRQMQEQALVSFGEQLQQLEAENSANALRDIQITLESLPPKQVKDIIFDTLTDATKDPGDDAMSDLVTIIKAMPAEKLRKIFEEFKTTPERELLHEILVEIGKLDERDTQLTGTKA